MVNLKQLKLPFQFRMKKRKKKKKLVQAKLPLQVRAVIRSPDKMIIEINCEYRNMVGACKKSQLTDHCLSCALGSEWFKQHSKILVEDTDFWGSVATDVIDKKKLKKVMNRNS